MGHAVVAELVDALRSGRSRGNPVEVQVLSTAQENPVGVFLLWSGLEREGGRGNGSSPVEEVHETEWFRERSPS